ncbi:phenolic glucoside malonyltransferase 1-like [Apium graveolens]|uniref:phenolic glucoside malonyltransferase 1-like n=1 Tax=Apium graveolens TaxID=4045 RepID=UPI003D7AD8D2
MTNAPGNNMVDVLDHCRVSPSLDLSVTKTLPLTFFDIFWLNWPSLSRVYFYEIPCSTTEFTQTIVPHLKKSLASTLEHYYRFCGNLLIPTTLSDNTIPAIRYLDGDSVSLVIAEFSGVASEGLTNLSGNDARDVEELLALVPELPRGSTDTSEDGTVMVSPVLALQVTLFRDHGFSVGIRNSHVVADGKSMYNFIRTWTSISAKQLIGEDDFKNLDSLPFYDRSVIKDPNGMGSIFLRESLRMAEEYQKDFAHAGDKKKMVQATFVMNRAQIHGLKNLVSGQVPHVSTFVAVCAYVWTCMAKARAALGQETNVEAEVVENFVFAMDARARLDPPIASNYFGNAVLGCWTSLKTIQLVGEEGFGNAVKKIRTVLDEQINNEEGVLKGMDTVFDRIEARKGQMSFGVAGSPKFDYYSADFGWGKPKKYKVISEKFALAGSRDSEGDLELGFCFSKDEMDAFTTIFTQGLLN